MYLLDFLQYLYYIYIFMILNTNLFLPKAFGYWLKSGMPSSSSNRHTHTWRGNFVAGQLYCGWSNWSCLV